MHLTATIVAAAIRAPLMGPRTSAPRPPAHPTFHGAIPARVDFVFRCPVTNFLGMRRIGFHYSVTRDDASTVLGYAYVGHLPLNDEVPVSKSGVAIPCVRAQGSDE